MVVPLPFGSIVAVLLYVTALPRHMPCHAWHLPTSPRLALLAVLARLLLLQGMRTIAHLLHFLHHAFLVCNARAFLSLSLCEACPHH